MNKVGVTGAAGFIGSHLCERLLVRGHRGRAVSTTCRTARSRTSRRACRTPGFRFEQMDCTRRRELRAAFAGCDTIVHLAAQKIPRYGGALKTLEAERRRRERRRPRSRSSMDADARHRLDLATSTATRRRPSREDGTLMLGPPTTPPLGLRRLEAVRRARAAGAGRGARACASRSCACSAPTARATTRAGGAARRRRSSSACSTASSSTSTATASRSARSRTSSDTVDGFVRALGTPEARGEVINIGGTTPTHDPRARRARSRRPSASHRRCAPRFVPYDGAAGQLPGRPVPHPRHDARPVSSSASRPPSPSRTACA